MTQILFGQAIEYCKNRKLLRNLINLNQHIFYFQNIKMIEIYFSILNFFYYYIPKLLLYYDGNASINLETHYYFLNKNLTND